MELVVKTRDGTPVTHDVTKNTVRMVGADGESKDFVSTDNLPVLLENVEVTPDFSNGDQVFTAPDGMAVKSGIVRKPANLIPENIAEGVDIAGIIGTMAAGGGENVKVTGGTFTPTDSWSENIEHGLGVIPDVFVIMLNGTGNVSASSATCYAASVSQKLKDNLGLNICGFYIYTSGSTKYFAGSMTCYNDISYGLTKADERIVTAGRLSTSKSYQWIAIGGLT